ncbi:MAG: hypothetical protein JSS04_08875, partial [Proteobacteria bacterium]|nr:hypothetical protein [Pseudomonadota bacterium]
EGQVSLALPPASSVPVEAAPPDYVPPHQPASNAGPRPSRPAVPTPVVVPPAPPPTPTPGPQLECSAADGSRIRVTGNACPAGWKAAK